MRKNVLRAIRRKQLKAQINDLKDWKPLEDHTFEARTRGDLSPGFFDHFDGFWKNNYCTVCVQRNYPTSRGPAVRLMIQRLDDKPLHQWYFLQRVKNEVVGKDVWAVEYYPPESELVDEANVYWLFCFEEEGALPIPKKPEKILKHREQR